MIKKSDALMALVHEPDFSLIGGQEIIWHDVRPQPSEEEIQAKIIELQSEYDNNQYQRDRAISYPSWQDQLDNIFHNGIDAWKADIQAIKDQFPKP